jgi:lipoprotein-releasing system permease protein
MVGVELAADLGLRAGDRFTIDTGSAAESVRVSALLDLGVKDLNRRTVLVPLRSAQSLLGLPGGATVLELQLADVWQAQDMARQMRQTYPYRVESWQDNNAQLLSALAAQSISTAVIRAVVLAVVVLGIASVLVVSVVQKRREIGILRAMGATRGQIARVFLLQGAMVGAVGSVAGLLLAALLIWAFTQFVRGPDGGPLFMITLSLPTMLQVSLLATLSGVLAAAAPARRAAAMDPAQAIRI